jgi:hypothetical protein
MDLIQSRYDSLGGRSALTQDRCVHTGQHTSTEWRQTSMSRMGFEPTTLVFEGRRHFVVQNKQPVWTLTSRSDSKWTWLSSYKSNIIAYPQPVKSTQHLHTPCFYTRQITPSDFFTRSSRIEIQTKHSFCIRATCPANLRYTIIRWNSQLVKLFRVLNYPRNRPWRPIGLWDVEDPTFSRQSIHRWR